MLTNLNHSSLSDESLSKRLLKTAGANIDSSYINCNQFEQSAIIAASASSWNYSVAEGYGWTMTPVDNSSDDPTC